MADINVGQLSEAINNKADRDLNNLDSIGYHKVLNTGIIMYYTKNTAPSGWLVCDGAAISRTTYADLFTAIGTTFGTGDGSTTFNLPNLIDKFPQGNTTVGTVKAAGLPNHRHDIGFNDLDGTRYGARAIESSHKMAGFGNAGLQNYSAYTSYASDSNAIYGASTTVQPPALTLLPCIKY